MAFELLLRFIGKVQLFLVVVSLRRFARLHCSFGVLLVECDVVDVSLVLVEIHYF